MLGVNIDSKMEETWEKIYSSSSYRHKNEYPSEDVVSFIMRNYGEYSDRSHIRVLDMGCGWGNNLKFLYDKGFDCYGIDYSISAVNECRKHYKNIEHGYLYDLPYDNNFFDIVIDRRSIQHNPKNKILDIFSEVHRVLKEGGRFLSILAGSDNYDIPVNKLSEVEIIRLLKDFSCYSIDFKEETSGNRAYKHKTFIVVATK